MESQENVAVFQRFVDEVINGGNVSYIDEVVSPDFVEHEELPPGMPDGREAPKALFSLLHVAFPDLHAEIDDTLAQDDRVLLRMTWTGTQTGDFMGIPPTGRRVEFDVYDIVRVVGGKITEHWGLINQMKLMQQLGMVPEAGAAPA